MFRRRDGRSDVLTASIVVEQNGATRLWLRQGRLRKLSCSIASVCMKARFGIDHAYAALFHNEPRST
jgi:hypothetical protein